eukprot:6292427-Pyramimonas_sp.AAC.1
MGASKRQGAAVICRRRLRSDASCDCHSGAWRANNFIADLALVVLCPMAFRQWSQSHGRTPTSRKLTSETAKTTSKMAK